MQFKETAFFRDLMRLVPLILVGALLVLCAAPVAKVLNEPTFAAWMVMCGAGFFLAALSHVLRRMLFPQMDLQKYAQAARQDPVGAGLVFVGVCIVLAAFVMAMGGIFK
jgi:hypothetical protein